jgi:hypothetical protein
LASIQVVQTFQSFKSSSRSAKQITTRTESRPNLNPAASELQVENAMSQGIERHLAESYKLAA